MFFRRLTLQLTPALKGKIFFNYAKEKDFYCNFPKLHLVKIDGKVLERHEFGEVSMVEIFEVVS
jgi:hypothetical protein